MNATDIDKIRKKIVREGFKPDKGGCNRYRQYISNKALKPGSIMKELIHVTIFFKADKTYLNVGYWSVQVIIVYGHCSYVFETYDYYPDIVDTLLLRINQYMAFEEFRKI
jgi:hypothetical protein